MSAGTHKEAELGLPELGLHLKYSPGDVMALCGKVLHEVQDWLGGERVCVTYYMKDFVHEYLSVPHPALPREV